jgi:hypothetical protein
MENHEGINLSAASLRKGGRSVKRRVCYFDVNPQLETSWGASARISSYLATSNPHRVLIQGSMKFAVLLILFHAKLKRLLPNGTCFL